MKADCFIYELVFYFIHYSFFTELRSDLLASYSFGISVIVEIHWNNMDICDISLEPRDQKMKFMLRLLNSMVKHNGLLFRPTSNQDIGQMSKLQIFSSPIKLLDKIVSLH